MIIKNRYLLLFIIKILDRLYGIKKFLKSNLKNIYHRIRIKYSDE